MHASIDPFESTQQSQVLRLTVPVLLKYLSGMIYFSYYGSSSSFADICYYQTGRKVYQVFSDHQLFFQCDCDILISTTIYKQSVFKQTGRIISFNRYRIDIKSTIVLLNLIQPSFFGFI